MKRLRISGYVRRQKNPEANGSEHNRYANILNREFYAERPTQKVVTDLTYMKHKGKWHSSAGYCNLLKSYNVIQSMSKAETPRDNAVIESFFERFKDVLRSQTLMRYPLCNRKICFKGTQDFCPLSFLRYMILSHSAATMHQNLRPLEFPKALPYYLSFGFRRKVLYINSFLL